MAEADRNDNNNNSRWNSSYTDGRPEKAGDVRNCILLVAAVVAVVTTMAAMNPPGGVWQETVPGQKGHVAGKSVYATSDHEKGWFYGFVICNTLAFTTAIIIIQTLSRKFPFYMEMVVNGTIVNYLISLYAVAPKSESLKFGIFLFASMLVPVLLLGLRRICFN